MKYGRYQPRRLAGMVFMEEQRITIMMSMSKLYLIPKYYIILDYYGLKKNQDAPRPSEHPPVRRKKFRNVY